MADIQDMINQLKNTYFLTQLLNARVYNNNISIGRLDDLVMVDDEKLPKITELIVKRPFGQPRLFIPWDKVQNLDTKKVSMSVNDLESFANEPEVEAVLLKDHILDKKIVDVEDREVEVVYDIQIISSGGKLFVSAVDLSHYGLLRRMRLKWLAEMIYPGYKKSKQIIPWTYVQPLPQGLGRFTGDVKLNVFKEKLDEMPPADVADILEEMEPAQRVKILDKMDVAKASDTLEEIDPSIQRTLISALKKEKVVKLLNEMTPAQAADVLSVLSRSEADKILNLLNPEDIIRIKAIVNKQEEQVALFATQDYIKAVPLQTVGDVQNNYASLARGKDVIMYFYVLDEVGKLLGVIDLKEILKADDNLLLKDVMVENVVSLNPESTLKDAYHEFIRYGFRALPITDNQNILLGVIPYRDVMNLKHRFV